MNPLEFLKNNLPEIESKIGYRFQNKDWAILAFIHRSFINENKALIDQHNERLEFLGDAILGMLVAEYLFSTMPANQEGDLSYLKSRLVEAASCVKYLRFLKLEKYVILGRGERMHGLRGRHSIFADLFEAIVAAIYLDGGFDAAKTFVLEQIEEPMQEILQDPAVNWKAKFQDYSQKKFQATPEYELLREEGPDHHKNFEVQVNILGCCWGKGRGSSKKEAQQIAAKMAYENRLIMEKENGKS